LSRADARARITRAAITLGVTEGVGAMSLRAIARTAGVSKALLLYHFAGKSTLLAAVAVTLGQASAVRLRAAAASDDALEAWRALVRDEAARGELALLAALSLELELGAEPLRALRDARTAAAAALASALLAGMQLTPRVPTLLLGRVLLRQLDGVAVGATRAGITSAALDAELDAFALALLALGR
jgi:AcrR family transcriptional regulator